MCLGFQEEHTERTECGACTSVNVFPLNVPSRVFTEDFYLRLLRRRSRSRRFLDTSNFLNMLNLNLNQRVFKGRKEPKQTGKRVQNKLSKSLMARYLDPNMFPNNTMGFRITMVDQMSLCCHGKSFSDSILTSRSHGMIVIIHCCNDSLITVAVMHLSMLQ